MGCEDISRIVLFQVGTSAAISAWKYVRVGRLGIYRRLVRSLPRSLLS